VTNLHQGDAVELEAIGLAEDVADWALASGNGGVDGPEAVAGPFVGDDPGDAASR
jgi:hypothetical protein